MVWWQISFPRIYYLLCILQFSLPVTPSAFGLNASPTLTQFNKKIMSPLKAHSCVSALKRVSKPCKWDVFGLCGAQRFDIHPLLDQISFSLLWGSNKRYRLSSSLKKQKQNARGRIIYWNVNWWVVSCSYYFFSSLLFQECGQVSWDVNGAPEVMRNTTCQSNYRSPPPSTSEAQGPLCCLSIRLGKYQ